MRKLMVVLVSMLVIPTGNLYGVLYVDISNPGETVVQSSPIGNSTTPHVRVDYYATDSPGTHYKLVPGGATYSQLRMHNNSRLTLSGGSVKGGIFLKGNSIGEIISGKAGATRVEYNSHLSVTGGTIMGYFGVYDNGRAEIYGGHFVNVDMFQITGNGIATLFGSDFELEGQPLPLGPLDIPELVDEGLFEVYKLATNYQYKGTLTGILSNGDRLNVELWITHFKDSRGNTANVVLVPDPATLSLFALGVVLLRKRRA